MNEQIVAIGGPGLYPEYRGDNTMADRREKEEDKPESGARRREAEGKVRAKKREEGEREQRTKDLERERGEAQESMRRTTEEVKRALEAARAKPRGQKEIATETKEAQGEKAPTLVESFPHLVNATRQQATDVLRSEGVSVDLPGNWDELGYVQKEAWLGGEKIVNVTKLPNVEARELGEIKYEDKKRGVAVVKEADGKWAIMGRIDMKRSTIEDFLKRAGAQGKLKFPDHWDQMAVREQRDFLRGNGVEVVAGMGGGALKHPDNQTVGMINVLDRLSELAQERDRDPAAYAAQHWEDWAELLPRLNQEIDRFIAGSNTLGVVSYDEFNSFVSRINDLQNSLREKLTVLDTFLPAATRADLKNALERLDDKYKQKYDLMDDATRASLLSDIESEAGTLRTSSESGWFQGMDKARDTLLSVAASGKGKEPIDASGIREWRATKLLEGLKTNILSDLLTKPPANWEESEVHLNNVLRLIESTDFAPSQLQIALQDAQRIIQRIPTGDEKGRTMFEMLSKRLKAVQAFQIFRVTMEQADMNPEKVIGSFEGFDDETFKLYFARFNHDARGREFKDSGGNSFNLLDKGLNVFFKRMHEERIKMNLVQDLSKKRRLNDGSSDEVEKWFVQRMADKGIDSSKWEDLETKNELIKEWYRETTLMGAHGVRDTDGKKYLDLSKFGEDGKSGLKGELMQRLRALGYTEVQLGDYDKTGLLDQVINNSYYFAWTFAWSDYDGIRIWDHNAEGIHGKGRWSGFAFNQNTHMFYGRNIDHTWEHFYSQEEQRGKVGKTNMVFQEALLGREGALLPQNRIMVRFAKRFLRTDKDTSDLLDEKIKGKLKTMRNIDKFDLSVPEEKGWAESAALAEIMDDAEFSFENVRFSEVFGKEESHVSKFAMVDLFADRAAHLKYMGPEELQVYLQGPNTKKFFEVNSVEKFYSKREVRIKPWMKLVIPVHQELGKYWKKWWKLPYKMPHAEAEEVINYAAETNRLDARDHGRMKFRYCGWGPIPGVWGVRHTRQFAETAGLVSVESGKMLWMIPFLILWEYFRQSFGQTKAMLEGK